ncbi:MAG: SpaA isopeptide-forming pilin-related protein, partial [Defluviitaleaceae bacterium]|nr:SpaA isopeptide-forming pilin-related protein [Defluviitaleaceae bacterium]
DGTTKTLISGDDGMIYIKGLKPGTYFLVETAPPDGYNALTAPIKVVIAATYDDGAVDYNYLTDVSYTIDNGTASSSPIVPVLNNAGSRLPESGGMGTRLFTIGGILLMLCAVLFVVGRKRFSRNNG